MAEDWAVDVRRYAPDADETVIAAIVRYLGIALRNRDSSLVSFTDKVETDRVRENFLKKKLGLTQSDAELDAAIAAVGERMKDDRTKNRVTVYYLLAEMFGKLGLFGAATAAEAEEPSPTPWTEAAPAVAAAAPVAEVPPAVAAPVAAAAVPVAAAAAAPVAAAIAHKPPAAPHRERGDDGIFGTAFATLGVLGLGILGAATFGSIIANRPAPAPMPAAPAVAVAAPAAPAIPEGAGVLYEEVEGKPAVSVYFETAKFDVTPDFATVAAPIKAWIDTHPGDRLAVSGYNDPRGDPAFNAELSKNRAQAVAAALAAIGVPTEVVDLVKPAETTDTGTDFAQARRVDIVVVEGS